jgi:hypothetical protein
MPDSGPPSRLVDVSVARLSGAFRALTSLARAPLAVPGTAPATVTASSTAKAASKPDVRCVLISPPAKRPAPGTITPVVAATGRPLPPIRVAAAWTGDPEDLAVSPSDQTLYAANQVTGTVVMIPAPRQ